MLVYFGYFIGIVKLREFQDGIEYVKFPIIYQSCCNNGLFPGFMLVYTWYFIGILEPTVFQYWYSVCYISNNFPIMFQEWFV